MRVISQLIGFDEFKAFCKARSTDSWQFSKKVTHGLSGRAGGTLGSGERELAVDCGFSDA